MPGLQSMEQVLEMVAGSIDFQNHKVAGAALYCLEDIIRNFRWGSQPLAPTISGTMGRCHIQLLLDVAALC